MSIANPSATISVLNPNPDVLHGCSVPTDVAIFRASRQGATTDRALACPGNIHSTTNQSATAPGIARHKSDVHPFKTALQPRL